MASVFKVATVVKDDTKSRKITFTQKTFSNWAQSLNIANVDDTHKEPGTTLQLQLKPTSESLAIPAPLSDLPVPQTLRPSTVPSVSLTIAGQFTVDDIDFVEVDLADEEPAKPPHSFLKALLSRVSNFIRRVKSVLRKKDL